jgi:TRAP-type mannitol/chloroaromatic compound transport system permease small subunit
MTDKSDTPVCPECEADLSDVDGMTTSTQSRWEWLGTLTSFLILASVTAITVAVSAGAWSLVAITQAWLFLYSAVVLTATAWTFGDEALQAVKNFRS